MNSATTHPAPASATVCASPATTQEVDASCRGPVLFLVFNSLIWLMVWSVFALLAAIKMHSGTFLANCPWLTYGRLAPAQNAIFLYGFASQAGMGIALWLLARLGRTKLACAAAAAIGGKFWNLGVMVGVIGILMGDGSGFASFEFPKYVVPLLFFAYLFVAVSGLLTFRARREETTYISQWLIFAAFMIFPWIQLTAAAMLHCHPVRGAMQSVVGYWFAANFQQLWLAPLALAAAFYIIPKIAEKPLFSRQGATMAFWLLLLVGGWTGIPAGARLPSWMPAISTAAKLLLLVPVISFGLNLKMTISKDGCDCTPLRRHLPFCFAYLALMFYAFQTLLAAGASFHFISDTTEFTLFGNALSVMFNYGFVAFALFGGIYYVVAQLTGMEWCPKGAKFQMFCSLFGFILLAVGLAGAGLVQGKAQMGGDFLQSVKSMIPFVGISSLGITFLLVAHFFLLGNFMGVMRRCCLSCCGSKKEAK